MQLIKYISLFAVLGLPFQYSFAEEILNKDNTPEIPYESSSSEGQSTDESGWKLITTDLFAVNFPTNPKIDKKAGITTYSSLDSGTFPVVMYTLTVNQFKSSTVDAAEEVTKYLEKLSTSPSNLLHHEIAESDDEIVVDTFCSDARTKVFRCERMIIVKDAIYMLTTLFFSNSAENHDYFISHFVRN